MTEAKAASIDNVDDDKYCRVCGVKLDRENQSGKETICKAHKRELAKLQKLSPEEKRTRLIGRLRDEDRIKRLYEWCKDYLIKHAVDLYVFREQNRAKNVNPDADIEKIGEVARDNAKNWTLKNARLIPPHRLMAKILTFHEITIKEEGDMTSTWHIAFDMLGYPGFPLDTDGLPVQPPGLPRSALVNAVRRQADKMKGNYRLGIQPVDVREPRRQMKKERRIVLARADDKGKSEVYDLAMAEMNRRHQSEIASKAQLKQSLAEPVDKSESLIDNLIKLWDSANPSGGGEQ